MFHTFGGPEVLCYEEVADPKAGPGELLLEVRGCGLNHVDLDVRQGISRYPVKLPHILGREIAGVVLDTGSGVSDYRPGDRVMAGEMMQACGRCGNCRSGHDNLCWSVDYVGLHRPGGYAERVAVPVAACMPMPSGVDFVDAAASQITFGTAWHALMSRVRLRPGRRVLITAAGSGVGSAGVQVAKLAGATVIAAASADDKLEQAHRNGADFAVNYRMHDLAEEVRRLTDGDGVDVVLENAGGAVFSASLKCLAYRGQVLMIGAHGGEVVPFDIIPMFRGEYELLGSCRATYHEVTEVMALIAKRALRPNVYATIPFAEASRAHALMAERKHYGKIVLVP